MEGREWKCTSFIWNNFKLLSALNKWHFHVFCQPHGSQKSTGDTQKRKRKRLKDITVESHQVTKKDSKRGKKGAKELENGC